jgi:hypothetical protein
MTKTPWEDSLLERKLQSDLKDLLKTLVAFANSVWPEHTATILIGERDDGSIQGVSDPDQIQKTVRKECDKIYPPILWRSHVYDKEGKSCVRVEIDYSGQTPHFGGIAWVRKGSETVKASDEVFQRLIEFRLSKVRELAKWKDKCISVEGDVSGMPERTRLLTGHPRWQGTVEAGLRFVNAFWATFQVQGTGKSEPLDKLSLSWDDKQNRLKVLVRD